MPGDARALRVLGIAGSLRAASFNRGLLRAAVEAAPAGIVVSTFDLLPVPIFNQDVEDRGDPEPVVSLKAAIRDADALLFATPEYNHGIPGALKNAIDWASRDEPSALAGKPAALMGATPGMGGTIRSQDQLRQALVANETHVMPRPELFVMKAGDKFDAAGNLTDEATRARIRKHLEALAVWARRLGASPA
jgi:chromate reductase